MAHNGLATCEPAPLLGGLPSGRREPFDKLRINSVTQRKWTC